MKRVLLLLAVVLAFTFTAMAQTESKTGDTGQATTTKAKKSKKGSAAGESGQAAGAAKEATLTGCLSAQPDKNGNFTLSNGRYKKGVEVGPADTVKEHAGHQVKLTGTWSAGEKGKKSFQATKVGHIAEKCETAPGGGTASEKPAGKTSEGKPKKEKKSSGGGGNPPPQM